MPFLAPCTSAHYTSFFRYFRALAKKTNTGEVRNAASAGIFMNGYRLRIDGTVRGVYKFELKFIAKYTGDREREMTRGPKNE